MEENLIIIHGESNFPSRDLFNGQDIYNTLVESNTQGKTLKYFIQHDFDASTAQEYVVNEEYKIENIDQQKIKYFILISCVDMYSQDLNSKITNLSKHYKEFYENAFVIFRGNNTTDIGKSIKKNEQLGALIKLIHNRYGTVSKDNIGKLDVKESKKGSDLSSYTKIWENIIEHTKNAQKRCSLGRDTSLVPKVQTQSQQTDILHSFITLGNSDRDLKNISNIFDGFYSENTDCCNNQINQENRLMNGINIFESINISGSSPDNPLEKWYQSIIDGIKNSKSCICHAFLIVINLNESYLDYTSFKTLEGFLKMMNQKGYNCYNKVVFVFIYNNTILPLFTNNDCCINSNHGARVDAGWKIAEKRDNHYESDSVVHSKVPDVDKLEEILSARLCSNEWKNLGTLISNSKKIFVNSDSFQFKNFFSELINLIKPKINIIFHGNTDFSQNLIKEKIGVNGEIQHRYFNLNFQYTNDFNLFDNIECQKIISNDSITIKKEENNIDEIDVFVLLISLEKEFNNSIREYIEKVIDTYKSKVNNVWKRVIFLFKMSDNEIERSIQFKINKSNIFKEFVIQKAESKYVAFSDRIERQQLIDLLVEQGIQSLMKIKESADKAAMCEGITNSLNAIKSKGEISYKSVLQYYSEDQQTEELID